MKIFQRPKTALKQLESVNKNRRKRTTSIKSSTIAVYTSVFLLIISVISIGYNQPQGQNSVSNVANINNSNPSVQASVDTVLAANVAAGVAQTTNLPIAISVTNLAISTKSQSLMAESDNISTVKPQIIGSGTTNRSVIIYSIKDGDTMNSLATKFGISAQTIKWANNMTTDYFSVGNDIKILPVDGVLYTVKGTDTVDSIATKYIVDKTRLIGYNDLEESGLKSDSAIILPNATLPENERPGYVAPVTYYYAGIGTGLGGGRTWYISSGTPDGPYAHGNCTLYVYNRRIQLGLRVGTNWGNAVSWAASARQDGLVVNSQPSVGAVMQNGGYLGHVAIVESIADNGDVTVSEMNAYVSGGGYNIVSGRIVPAGNVSQYLYIH